VTVEDVELDEAAAVVNTEGRTGRYARLSVADTGTGMDEKTRAKLFEPFFTTKEQGKGTGLGLSIVYGIVKQSTGYIAVASERGRGATFLIYLPLAAAPQPAPAAV
jgi:signal transduction histidine kinase